jgi:hypothetical protein
MEKGTSAEWPFNGVESRTLSASRCAGQVTLLHLEEAGHAICYEVGSVKCTGFSHDQSDTASRPLWKRAAPAASPWPKNSAAAIRTK